MEYESVYQKVENFNIIPFKNMIKKTDILKALELTKEVLTDLPDHEKSLSFPVVLARLLQEKSLSEKSGEKTENMQIDAKNEKEDFSGLTGGIRLLLKESFFKIEKTQGEIFAELKRQGYHYPPTSLPRILLRSFIQKKALSRYPGKDGRWRFVERK